MILSELLLYSVSLIMRKWFVHTTANVALQSQLIFNIKAGTPVKSKKQRFLYSGLKRENRPLMLKSHVLSELTLSECSIWMQSQTSPRGFMHGAYTKGEDGPILPTYISIQRCSEKGKKQKLFKSLASVHMSGKKLNLCASVQKLKCCILTCMTQLIWLWVTVSCNIWCFEWFLWLKTNTKWIPIAFPFFLFLLL